MTRRNDPLEAALNANLTDLLHYLERRVASRADAADVLGTAVEIIWKKARRLPADPEHARMWMFAIARNCLRNANRAHLRREATIERLRDHIVLTQPAAGEDDDPTRLRDAIERLPEAQRELIRLVHWEGFTVAAAAAITGVSSSTARSRYAAAKRRLREEIEPDRVHLGPSTPAVAK